jgi:hypothetical protein
MQVFGLEITGDHARVIFAAFGAAAAGAGFVAGRWGEHRRRVSFKREDLVTTTMVIELYGIQTANDGTEMLHIISQGSSMNIDQFFRSPVLVRHIQRASQKHPGLLHLTNPVAHRMMMDEGKDAITGLDAKANMDFVHGRPTRVDHTLFGFAAYSERDHDGNGLRDQIGRLVLMVVSPGLVEKLADATYVKHLRVAHSGHLPRCDRLHDFAREWQRLEALPSAQRSSAVDKIWSIDVRTSLG